jgi:predicted anti-sigma-YlaC factor YlaD
LHIDGNRTDTIGDNQPMDCSAWHDLISARIDNEIAPLEAGRLDQHLARCPSCRAFAKGAADVARAMRVRPAEPVPDLTPCILAAANPPGPYTRQFARVSLAWLAVLQIGAGLPALLLGDDSGATAHVARHLGSFDVAIAIGMLVAAWRPSFARSMLPVAAALAVCVAIGTSLDLAQGSTRAALEAPHLIQLLAVVLIWLLCGAPRPRRLLPARSLA